MVTSRDERWWTGDSELTTSELSSAWNRSRSCVAGEAMEWKCEVQAAC